MLAIGLAGALVLAMGTSVRCSSSGDDDATLQDDDDVASTNPSGDDDATSTHPPGDDDVTSTRPPGDGDVTSTNPPGDDDATSTHPPGDDDVTSTRPPGDDDATSVLPSSPTPTPCAAGALEVVPVTTLEAGTGNNTSAADSFATQTNGNLAPGNVSKVPTRTLLYDGASTRMYMHFMPWFDPQGDPGQAKRMLVGYNSNDAAQVKKQVDDMISRGFQGAIVGWYGRNVVPSPCQDEGE